MKAVCFLLAAVFLSLVTGEIADGNNDLVSTPFSAKEIQPILDRHNLLRGQVSPTASNMEFMTWDDDLASMAQDWSNKCTWDRGNPTNISPFKSVGQNIWMPNRFADDKPDGVGTTQTWFNEYQYYNFEANNCSSICRNYKQVVSGSTSAVGCGRTFCPSVSNGRSDTWIVACNYGSAVDNSERPYLNGSSCTKCASGVGECYENKCRLCTEHSEHCDCKAECQNCGTVSENCTCQCQDGWYGDDCTTVCENTNKYCGASPGWPSYLCAQPKRWPFVVKYCPLLCGLCNAADPDQADQTCENSLVSGSQQEQLNSGRAKRYTVGEVIRGEVETN